MNIISVKSLVTMIAVGTGLMAGCRDQMLPPVVDPPATSTPASRIAFAEINNTVNWSTGSLVVSLRTDGNNRFDYAGGVFESVSNNGKVAYIYNDTLWLGCVYDDGTKPRILYPESPYQGLDRYATSISPDGSKVSFTIREAATYTMNANGTGLHILPVGASYETMTRFSPDGKRLALYVLDESLIDTGETIGKLYIVNVDGTDLRAVKVIPSIGKDGYMDLAWSPDGTRLAYVTSSTPYGINPELHVTNIDGGNDHLVGYGDFPSWSPDGKQIAYSNIAGYVPVLNIVNSDGTGEQTLPGLAMPITYSYPCYPRWSPDGKSILYTSIDGKINETPGSLMVYDIATKSSKKVADRAYKGFWVQ